MPGSKTHSGTKKRSRTAGLGRLVRKIANERHLLEHKSSHRTRRLSQDQVVVPSDVKRVKKLLGK